MGATGAMVERAGITRTEGTLALVDPVALMSVSEASPIGKEATVQAKPKEPMAAPARTVTPAPSSKVRQAGNAHWKIGC
jgi:hypothetical protein